MTPAAGPAKHRRRRLRSAIFTAPPTAERASEMSFFSSAFLRKRLQAGSAASSSAPGMPDKSLDSRSPKTATPSPENRDSTTKTAHPDAPETPPASPSAPPSAPEATAPPEIEDHGYNFAYLDEHTKRMIRRAILKAVAVPGYQTPFASREMPMPYGWGTGGVQVTAACLTPADTLKVIDQGADDTTNAVSLRQFFEKTAGVATTTETEQATLIQTRHRIPETALSEDQILIYQVPIPEPLRFLEPREIETRKMHALEEYGLMHVKLYEDISRHGHIATTYNYPVKVEERYVMAPSPIPKFDNPKMSNCPALQLFGAGREQRIYALPPYTRVKSLDFEDYPFDPGHWEQNCALCGAEDSYLDEIITDDDGGRMFVCSDTDFCIRRRDQIEQQQGGAEGAA